MSSKKYKNWKGHVLNTSDVGYDFDFDNYEEEKEEISKTEKEINKTDKK